MAAKRGKSQARRNGSGGLPGWAWMILGIVIALAAVMFMPKLLKSDRADGFFRPQPNPSAQPAVSAIDEAEPPPVARPADATVRPGAEPDGAGGVSRPRPTPSAQPAVRATDGAGPPPVARPADATVRPGAEPAPAGPEYDFYTVLPEQEVALTDAELAASAREEAERQRRTLAAQQQRERDAAEVAAPAPPTAAATTTTAPAAPAADGARYLLQAGSFSSHGDAEALKARIALLGLSARVEEGTAN